VIWLTWRQHRLQILIALGFLGLSAALMLPSGWSIASHFRASGLASCLSVPGRACDSQPFSSRYTGLAFTIPLYLIVPAMIGVFWGAPLVSRELERGTHRLAWTQSISRTRWILTKVLMLSGVAIAGSAAFAWLVTWWSQYFVAVSDDRFSRGVFDLRGIVPIAYTLFALAVGVGAGTFIRKTIPAMLASVGIYGAVRFVVEFWVRPHYAAPATINYSFFGKTNYPRSGLGDWILSTKTLDGAGHLLGNGQVLDFNVLGPRCPGLIGPPGSMPEPTAVKQCAQQIGLHIQSVYQPGSRFWAFQGIESAIFVILALALFALSVRRVRSRIA
jgi:hypothetical protein